MSDTKHCDFYADRESIQNLSDKYTSAFDILTRKRTEIDAALGAAKANGCLKGEWYDAFYEQYQQWSEGYTRLLAALLLLNSALLLMDERASMLIKNRDDLSLLF